MDLEKEGTCVCLRMHAHFPSSIDQHREKIICEVH